MTDPNTTDPSTTDPNTVYRTWLRQLASRRRFGNRDRLGTANLIDAAARRRGAEATREGQVVSLARPLADQPTQRQDGLPGFKIDVFYTDGPIGMGSDHVQFDCHGRTNTHLDSLNHISVDRTWYCGWDVEDTTGPSVAHLADHGLVTRGVLVDVPGMRGSEWADPEMPVTADELDAALERAGVRFEPGDALLLYMGRDRFEAAGHEMADLRSGQSMPGPGASAARWIADHDVSMLCWDFLDSSHPSEPAACVHLLIWGIGLILVDNCDLSAAAAAARRRGSVTGGLVVAPLAVPGGTGCLVRPLFIQ
jgi:kynurenine formamidase